MKTNLAVLPSRFTSGDASRVWGIPNQSNVLLHLKTLACKGEIRCARIGGVFIFEKFEK